MVERKFPKLKAGGSSPFSLVAVVFASLGVTKDGKNIRSFFLFVNTYKEDPLIYYNVCMGIGGIERPTSRLSGVRSHH